MHKPSVLLSAVLLMAVGPHLHGSEAAERWLDVLVLCTSSGTATGREAAAAADVAVLDTALRNARTGLRARLVAVQGLAYAGSGNLTSDLYALSRGSLPEASTLRERFGADVVVMSTYAVSAPAGLADGLVQPFCVINGALGDGVTLPHEVGHCLGCDHDLAHATHGGISNHGWSFLGDNNMPLRTLMCYGNQTILPAFSDPSAEAAGMALGVAGQADNAAAIRGHAATASAFRATAAGMPAAQITAPLAGSAVAAGPLTITVGLTGSWPVAGVRLEIDGVALGTRTAPPWEWTWDSPTPGPCRMRAVVLGAEGGVFPSADTWIVVAGGEVADGWRQRAIGPGAAGTVTAIADGLVIAGASTIAKTAGSPIDSHLAAFRPLAGDGSITVRVEGVAAAAGLEWRESLAADARAIGIYGLGSSAMLLNRRCLTALPRFVFDRTFSRSMNGSWMRFSRAGSSFSVESSPDGAAWELLTTFRQPMAADAYLCLVGDRGASSGSPVTFHDIAITGTGWDDTVLPVDPVTPVDPVPPGPGGGGAGVGGGGAAGSGSGGGGGCGAGGGMSACVGLAMLLALGLRRRSSV